MRSFLAFACVAAIAVAAAQDPAAVDAAVHAGKAPPKLTENVSAPDVLAACREMLPRRPIKLAGALILRNRKGIVQKECDYSLVMRRGKDTTHLAINLFARHETNELASVEISRRGDERPTIQLISDGAVKSGGSPLDRAPRQHLAAGRQHVRRRRRHRQFRRRHRRPRHLIQGC